MTDFPDGAEMISMQFVLRLGNGTTACAMAPMSSTGQPLSGPVPLEPHAAARIIGAWVNADSDATRLEAITAELLRGLGFDTADHVRVFCPGCGRELHGAMVSRGACVDCFPTVSEDATIGVD